MIHYNESPFINNNSSSVCGFFYHIFTIVFAVFFTWLYSYQLTVEWLKILIIIFIFLDDRFQVRKGFLILRCLAFFFSPVAWILIAIKFFKSDYWTCWLRVSRPLYAVFMWENNLFLEFEWTIDQFFFIFKILNIFV